MFTKYHSLYYATLLTLQRPKNTLEGLTIGLSGAKVDLNPHQVDAALFAFRSPLSQGVLLADEVGLGKTIEAGIVISQLWAERKRNILIIVPASLRSQWMAELADKFYIPSQILDTKIYNDFRKKGVPNPFKIKDQIIICSYNFAALKSDDIQKMYWNIVIIDEAHRLRNVYKPSNKIGNKLKTILQGKRKILLTATPLQNSLMELYGLLTFIDDHLFGDAATFRGMYLSDTNESVRNSYLKKRLEPFCKRTLRKQVVEYVPYTKRIPILQEYSSSDEEDKLYNMVAEYLRRKKLVALPSSQRSLMTTILWKLLASSSYAIAGTLEALILRVENYLHGIDAELTLDDYDQIDQMLEEWASNGDDEAENTGDEFTKESVLLELKFLKDCLDIAKGIKINTKGSNLISALKRGFEKATELGSLQKAVIFTESKRTQDYLFQLLSGSGYNDKIVILNGSNNDDKSLSVYKKWLGANAGSDIVTGSKQADMKSAIVDEFKNNASILIGTEAAAEGINLQFCSLVVNYDMPWNPQRIEQRIGRCHRYGQKNDVVVVNFLNIKNAADKRVYELLDMKFQLFSGVFGASDEVLGSIESGMDFEKRIASIYQTCRSSDEIEKAFDEIQNQFQNQIDTKMIETRSLLLENFDEDVNKRLKLYKNDTLKNLTEYEDWLFSLLLSEDSQNVRIESDNRFYYNSSDINTRGYYIRDWRNSNSSDGIFFRLDSELAKRLIDNVLKYELQISKIIFDYSNYETKITFFENLQTKRGWFIMDKLISNPYQEEEYLIFTCISDDGTLLDEDISKKLMGLEALTCEPININELPQNVEVTRKNSIDSVISSIYELNNKFYKEECDKLDNWSEDLKNGLENELKQKKRELSELKKARRNAPTLKESVDLKNKENALTKEINEKQKNLFDEQDKIEQQNDELQENIKQRLSSKANVNEIMKFRWEIK